MSEQIPDEKGVHIVFSDGGSIGEAVGALGLQGGEGIMSALGDFVAKVKDGLSSQSPYEAELNRLRAELKETSRWHPFRRSRIEKEMSRMAHLRHDALIEALTARFCDGGNQPEILAVRQPKDLA